ncbi:hypothetical protein L209DRAFT_71974 [Thermothelomyces heterothallicus CBS 203.75]
MVKGHSYPHRTSEWRAMMADVQRPTYPTRSQPANIILINSASCSRNCVQLLSDSRASGLLKPGLDPGRGDAAHLVHGRRSTCSIGHLRRCASTRQLPWLTPWLELGRLNLSTTRIRDVETALLHRTKTCRPRRCGALYVPAVYIRTRPCVGGQSSKQGRSPLPAPKPSMKHSPATLSHG